MKARLKSIVLSAVGAIAVFSTVTITSCNDDPCKAIVCAYGGTCTEGECLCPSGYEGTHCEIVTREKYEGVWTVFEDGTVTKPAQYEIRIKNGVGATDMTISNFYNRFPGNDVSVRVKGDSLFIPQQTVNGYVIEGSGYLNWERENFYPEHGELIVHYTIKDPEGKLNDFGVNAGSPSTWSH